MKNAKLQDTIARLTKMASQKKSSGTGKKINYWKAKQGKNELLVLPFPDLGDPFLEWGEHKNLLEPSYLSIPCAQHNSGEPCPVCDVVKDLKNDNWKGNKEIWSPIETKTRFYSPVIDLNDVEAGIQWFSYGKTVLSQFQTWLVNLEEDESAFYDLQNPEKIIVNYDKEADAALRYKLDRKVLKKLPEGLEDLEDLVENMDSLPELLNQWKRSDEELAQIVDDYLRTVTEALAETEESDDDEPVVKKSKKVVEDDDDEPVIKKTKKVVEVDDDDDDEPVIKKTKKVVEVDDDDDDEPVIKKSKKVVDEEDDDDEPVIKKSKKVADDDDDTPRLKSLKNKS